VKKPFRRFPGRLIEKLPGLPEGAIALPLSELSTKKFASEGKRIGTPFSRGIKSVILSRVMIFYGLHTSDKPEKKYYVEMEGESGRRKRIYFGQAGAKDYTLHNALERDERRRNYISRHRATEDWTASGIETPGFWSKHLLWGDTPSVQTNLKRTVSRFNLSRSDTR
jgi:hypothetical protein